MCERPFAYFRVHLHPIPTISASCHPPPSATPTLGMQIFLRICQVCSGNAIINSMGRSCLPLASTESAPFFTAP